MVSHDCACCVDYNCIANCFQVALSASLKTRFLFIYCCTWLRLKISHDFFFFPPVILGPDISHLMHTEFSIANSLLPVEFLNTSPSESLHSLLFVLVHSQQPICIFIPCVHDHRIYFCDILINFLFLKDSTHHIFCGISVFLV